MARKQVALTRSEQLFFGDPAIDRLMGVLMSLATEHFVMRDRIAALERELAAAGHIDPARLEAYSAANSAVDEADAAEFTRALLEPLLGLQKSLGVGGHFTLNEKRGRG